MSQRASFVTQYIYCPMCHEGVRSVMLANPPSKHWAAFEIPSWEGRGEVLPIIAGKIGGMYSDEELVTMENEIIPKIEEVICHEVRVVVVPDDSDGARTFIAHPAKGD